MRLKNDTENFAASFNITPPYQMRVIHSSKLIYPREIYQRGVQRKRVELIATDFNEYVANEPKISFRNGKYYVVDPFSSGRQSSTSSSRKSVLDGIMILRSSSMFRWRSLKNLRVIRSRCVLRVGGKRTLNKHPLGGWVLRMGESSFLTKLLVKL